MLCTFCMQICGTCLWFEYLCHAEMLVSEAWNDFIFTHSFFSHLSLPSTPVCSSHHHHSTFSSIIWLFFFVSCSPWRLCGPQPGPPSPFCPVDRSRLFSTRCLSSETCTKASTAAWRHGWMLTATLNQTQERRERGATQALSWWWETCSWKWWACCCVKMTTCVNSWVMLRNLLETNKYMGQRHKENSMFKGNSCVFKLCSLFLNIMVCKWRARTKSFVIVAAGRLKGDPQHGCDQDGLYYIYWNCFLPFTGCIY